MVLEDTQSSTFQNEFHYFEVFRRKKKNQAFDSKTHMFL